MIIAKIVIEGKERNCSEILKQEIEWQDIRIATAIKLAKMIEDKQEVYENLVSKNPKFLHEIGWAAMLVPVKLQRTLKRAETLE